MVRTGIDFYDSSGSYSIRANSGQDISWSNISGHIIRSVDMLADSDPIFCLPISGIYIVSVTDAGTPTKVTVTESFPYTPLPFSQDTNEITVYEDSWNYNVIPGLKLFFASTLYLYSKSIVIVGGKWNDSEERVIRDTIFDTIVQGKVADEKTIRIKNNTGLDLRYSKARIISSCSTKQPNSQYSKDTYTGLSTSTYAQYGIFGYRESEANDAISDLSGELLTRMTGVDTPSPVKAVGSHYSSFDGSLTGGATTTTYHISSRAYYPFSADGGYLYVDDSIYSGMKGWYWSNSSSLWELLESYIYTIKEPDTVYLRYDFGKGNSQCVNRIGIYSLALTQFVLQASSEDVDEPVDWVDLFTWDLQNLSLPAYPSDHTRRIRYKNFPNFNSYRHYRISPRKFYDYSSVNSGQIREHCIGRVELLNADYETVANRNRPFIFIDQQEIVSPPPRILNNSYRISFSSVETWNWRGDWSVYSVSYSINDGVENDNKNYICISAHTSSSSNEPGTGLSWKTYWEITNRTETVNKIANILIDNDKYDVIDVNSGEVKTSGKNLKCDGETKYRFAESSPCDGMTFILSENTELLDTALIWSGNGGFAFSLKNNSDTYWKSKEEVLTLTESGENSGVITNGGYVDVNIKCIAPNIEVNDAYPSEGLIQVVAKASDYESIQSIYSGSQSTWDNRESYTLRQVLPPFTYYGHQVRFKITAFSHAITISSMFFGVHALDGSFSEDFVKQRVLFSDLISTSISLGNSLYTDWIDFLVDGDSEYMVAMYGTGIGHYYSYSSYNKKVKNYIKYGINETYLNEASGYTESSSVKYLYEIAEIQVRRKKEFCASMPLTGMFVRKETNISLSSFLSPSSIKSNLESFGISFEEAS
ncbi:MAG: hypothetical protein ACFFCZ_20260 [Promethearchaeota archaeon]